MGSVGAGVGVAVVGAGVGAGVGAVVGAAVGATVGPAVGAAVQQVGLAGHSQPQLLPSVWLKAAAYSNILYVFVQQLVWFETLQLPSGWLKAAAY